MSKPITLTKEQQEEVIFKAPTTSLRTIAQQLLVPMMTVRRYCHENGIDFKFKHRGRYKSNEPKKRMKETDMFDVELYRGDALFI